MSIEENKALVRRYFEDAPHNSGACDEIFAPRFQFHTLQRASVTPQAVESTPQSEKTAYAWLRTVWGDWRMTVDEMIAEGDQVVVLWTFHGTQQAEFYGLPPTGRPVTYSGINIFRLSGDKIVEIRDIYDRCGCGNSSASCRKSATPLRRRQGPCVEHRDSAHGAVGDYWSWSPYIRRQQ